MPRKLSRDSAVMPELSPEPGRPIIHPKYRQGQKVRYTNVGDREPLSIGTIKTVLKDVIPPVGPEEVRYEVENEQRHTSTAIPERNIVEIIATGR